VHQKDQLTGSSLDGAPSQKLEAVTDHQLLRILDIGTGTGVLALMMAQTASQRLQQHQRQHQDQQQLDGGSCSFVVDALEIEASAAQQAAANAAGSPWRTSIRVHHTSLQDWVCQQRPHLGQPLQANSLTAAADGGWYHTIVCNPPFFVASSKPQDTARALARHAESLPYEDLAAGAAALLHPVLGSMFVILPYKEACCFAEVAALHGLHVCHVLRVYSCAEDPEPVRLVLQLARHPQQQPLRPLAVGDARVGKRVGDAVLQKLQGGLLEEQEIERGSACGPAAVEDLVIRQRVLGDAGRVAYTEQYRALTADFHHPSAFRE
jgi:tRNA1Val (adenine37-N6)-methyltransferase